MNLLDRVIAQISPGRALERVRARAALKVVAHYDAASGGRRSKSWRPAATDADGASLRRQRLSFVSRDMIRNTPFAARAQHVIANNVVGDGIIPKIIGSSDAINRQGLDLIERHLDTTAIDADGRQNLYGLQRLAMNCIVDSGEVIIRRRRRDRTDGLPLPFQIQVLEPDHIDDTLHGALASGNHVREGIEYDLIGRRVAYYLLEEHPGGDNFRGFRQRGRARRVPASEILHVYRQDRPGQMRGVTWFAPIALNLQDLGDHQDAQLVRQKIAACFTAFRISPDDAEAVELAGTLKPGAIMDLGPGEDIRFADPPSVGGYDEFTRGVLRSVASGLGLTYEALTGDLSNVNFSSARMGRMEMDRNVSSWQHLMMVPLFLEPFANWFREAWVQQSGNPRVASARITWTPPHRFLVDPAREIGALRDKVRAGFASRQGVVRELGFDPERLIEEQVEDNAIADQSGLIFDTDGRHARAGQAAPNMNGGNDEPE